MKKLLKYVVCLAILVMVVALFTGCDFLEGKITGGGWFMNECGDETKCTFGFVAQGKLCDYKGQFQFNDHADTKIHADVLGLLELGETCAWFRGKTSDEDELYVYVEDKGQPGADPGDYIEIYYKGDKWCGKLGGGNLKIHKED